MHTVHDLDDLITEFLADGIITAKERAVLLRKAEKLGIDHDEADLYIDAQQQKADQKIDAAVAKKRGASCPYCGGSIPLLTDKCPHCGQNITPEASEELQEIFDDLEEALINFKAGKDTDRNKAVIDRYVRKAKMYYENNPKVQRLLAQVEKDTAVSEQKAAALEASHTAKNLLEAVSDAAFWRQKIEIIRNFPISNNRENIVEILTICQANSIYHSDDYGEQAVVNAWRDKAKEVIAKAQAHFPNDPEIKKLIKGAKKAGSGWSNLKKMRVGFLYVPVAFFVIYCGVPHFVDYIKGDNSKQNTTQTELVETPGNQDETSMEETDDMDGELTDTKVDELVTKYLEEGNLDKSKSTCADFLKANDNNYSLIQTSMESVIEALIKREKYDDVMDLVKDCQPAEIADAQRACIDDMVDNDRKGAAKKFVEKYYKLGCEDDNEADVVKMFLLGRIGD